jgi:hypothetical protein
MISADRSIVPADRSMKVVEAGSFPQMLAGVKKTRLTRQRR